MKSVSNLEINIKGNETNMYEFKSSFAVKIQTSVKIIIVVKLTLFSSYSLHNTLFHSSFFIKKVILLFLYLCNISTTKRLYRKGCGGRGDRVVVDGLLGALLCCGAAIRQSHSVPSSDNIFIMWLGNSLILVVRI